MYRFAPPLPFGQSYTSGAVSATNSRKPTSWVSFAKKGGLRSAQIGHIELAAHTAYVAVERKALAALLKQVAGEKIKGMKTIIEEMRQ